MAGHKKRFAIEGIPGTHRRPLPPDVNDESHARVYLSDAQRAHPDSPLTLAWRWADDHQWFGASA